MNFTKDFDNKKQDTRNKIQDTRYKKQETRYKMQDARCKMQDARDKVQELKDKEIKKEKPKIQQVAEKVPEGVRKIGVKGVSGGLEATEKGIELASKGIQVAGKGVQMVGKGVELVGQGVETVGNLMEKKTQEEIQKAVRFVNRRRSIRDFFWKSKRGVITGCADNDPAGIVTYSQVGAVSGLKLIWLCLVAWPLLSAVEEMSARIGVVTKKGMNEVIIENYGLIWAWLAAIIVLICNTFTMGVDIAAMADVLSILTKIPAVIFTILIGGLFFYLLWKKGYRELSRYLFLLTPFFLLYVISALFLNVPWGEALRNTFLPQIQSLNLDMALMAVAFLGTTISPYLIFWETTQEVEENRTVATLGEENAGVTFGMFFSQFITFFIIVAAAAAFSGVNHELTTAKEVALALKPFGKASFLLYTLGILGSGLLAVPVLAASTGYTFSETLSWKRGLDKSVHQAKGFYAVMLLTLIIGIAIAFFKFNPVLALVYSQVLNGLLMPILILILLLASNNKKIMGNYTNKFWSNFFGILALLIIVAADILLVYQWIK